jgi:hypothetical protein
MPKTMSSTKRLLLLLLIEESIEEDLFLDAVIFLRICRQLLIKLMASISYSVRMSLLKAAKKN